MLFYYRWWVVTEGFLYMLNATLGYPGKSTGPAQGDWTELGVLLAPNAEAGAVSWMSFPWSSPHHSLKTEECSQTDAGPLPEPQVTNAMGWHWKPHRKNRGISLKCIAWRNAKAGSFLLPALWRAQNLVMWLQCKEALDWNLLLASQVERFWVPTNGPHWPFLIHSPFISRNEHFFFVLHFCCDYQ